MDRKSRPDVDPELRQQFVDGMRAFVDATKNAGDSWGRVADANAEVAEHIRKLSRRVLLLAFLAALGFVSTAAGGIALGYRLEAFSEAIRGAGDQAAGARDQAADTSRRIDAVANAVTSPALEVKPGPSGDPVLVVRPPGGPSSVEIPIGGPAPAHPKRAR